MSRNTPTNARDVALHFFGVAEKDMVPSEIGKSVNQAKGLLNKGYTTEQLVRAIDYYVLENPPGNGMHSLGFLFHVMEDFVGMEYDNAQRKKNKEVIKTPKEYRGGLKNEDKVKRNNNKSRLREKYSFDMFKEPE